MNTFLGKHGPLLIAEIGGNHEGDFEYAKKLTQLAIESDADYIKFQIYSGDSLVSSKESPDRNKHFKKFELTQSQHQELAQMVIDAGKLYTSSVWDADSLDWIDNYMSLYKIGSGDLTAYPLLKNIAKRGKPIIISTGLSTEKEVLETVDYVQSVNSIYSDPSKLAVLQCTSMYPIESSDAHLNVMQVFKEKTDLTVGYSDHTEGITALKYAVCLGAEILEFHFTDDRTNKNFRDHKVSLTKEEVHELIAEIKLIQSLQGDATKRPLSIEMDNGHDVSFRRAVYPSRDILAGEVLSEDNLTILRPNHGIDAREYYNLVGKKAKMKIEKHQKLTWDLFE
ncbi:N-acetylneuraminate synthase family protein [Fulvivirga maritima]|uniref:N-acetylneuraminate synthase family protein n=1 Tax=Fulvivirga maritima TaxID=2904247 RepID=UPI001F3FAE80|nr:N-acetylneuraminate synthase family protein [Fulvivirga maritima]UII24833.1 N-acetylneuraminate synthase family protein [Fulvivirga maritima]